MGERRAIPREGKAWPSTRQDRLLVSPNGDGTGRLLRPTTPALRPLLLQTRGRLAVPNPRNEVDALEGAARGDAVRQLAREAHGGGPFGWRLDLVHSLDNHGAKEHAQETSPPPGGQDPRRTSSPSCTDGVPTGPPNKPPSVKSPRPGRGSTAFGARCGASLPTDRYPRRPPERGRRPARDGKSGDARAAAWAAAAGRPARWPRPTRSSRWCRCLVRPSRSPGPGLSGRALGRAPLGWGCRR